MDNIHIDSDAMLLTARSFWQINDLMSDQLFLMRMAYYRLEMSWEGGRAEDYQRELKTLLDRLQGHVDELISLGLKLSRQADLWDESDQRWSVIYREKAR